MILDPRLIDGDLVGVVEDVDGVVAHYELGSLLLLEQQSRVVVTLGRSTLFLLGINLKKGFNYLSTSLIESLELNSECLVNSY